jgi:hypothetical protein
MFSPTKWRKRAMFSRRAAAGEQGPRTPAPGSPLVVSMTARAFSASSDRHRG